MSGEEPNNQDSLSQEDIDAALAAAGGSAPDAAAGPEEAAEAVEAQAPTDADAATVPDEAATPADAQAQASESPSPAETPEPGGPFSQDDIDAVLSNEGGKTPAPAAAATPAAAEAIDQSDIDAVLASAEGTQDAGGGLDQDDIDAAMAAAEETVAQEQQPNAAEDSAEASPGGEVKLDSAGRPFDAAAAMMEAAIAEERAAAAAAAANQAAQPPPPPPLGSKPIEMPDLSSVDAGERSEQSIELLNDVELDVKIELGRAQMLIENVLQLGSGSVVELDKLAGDPVDVFVNERLVARGEVIVLNENFCVRINEIVAAVEEEELV